jgi:UDP-galactopyranose mutase
MIDYIIIGSGLAGVVIAERIATQLNKKVLVKKKGIMLQVIALTIKTE